jgi:hypothetical protein
MRGERAKMAIEAAGCQGPIAVIGGWRAAVVPATASAACRSSSLRLEQRQTEAGEQYRQQETGN